VSSIPDTIFFCQEIEIPPAGDNSRSKKKRKITASTAATLAAHTDKAHLTREHVSPTVEHVLSRELQLYYESLMRAMVNTEHDNVVLAALGSLSKDAGISQLLPYMVQFIVDEVAHSVSIIAENETGKKRSRDRISDVAADLGLTPFRRIQRAVSMCRAIFDNPTLYVEPYLHQIMPALLTCAVGKQIHPDKEEQDDNGDGSEGSSSQSQSQWAIRDAAAKLVAEACSVHGNAYANLRPRVSETYASAFASSAPEGVPMRPLCSHYGAIRGMAELGSRAVSELLLARLGDVNYAAWFQEQKGPDAAEVRRALEYAVEVWLSSRIQDADVQSGLSEQPTAAETVEVLKGIPAIEAPLNVAESLLGADGFQSCVEHSL
jgi:TAF6 C-terminal HEAT repeat domain